jgi:hypothetical protein
MIGAWPDASNERESRSGYEADARCFGGAVVSIVGDTEMSATMDTLSCRLAAKPHGSRMQVYGPRTHRYGISERSRCIRGVVLEHDENCVAVSHAVV